MRETLLVVGLFAGLIAILTLRSSRAFRRLAESRGREGFAEFSASLPDVPEEIQRKVFDWVLSLCGTRKFPVRATDVLLDVYPVDVEGLEEALLELPKACGRGAPLLNVWKGRPVITVGDLARFVARLPTLDQVDPEGSRRLWTDDDLTGP